MNRERMVKTDTGGKVRIYCVNNPNFKRFEGAEKYEIWYFNTEKNGMMKTGGRCNSLREFHEIDELAFYC